MPRHTPAVLRTMDILELFIADGPPLTAPAIAKRTGFPRTSVHELLTTLVARSYLQRDEATGTYRLGPLLLQLGNAYSARFDLLAAANKNARALAATVGETASVAIREGADVFYLAKAQTRDVVRIPSVVGQRLPANCTSLGKALLADLSFDELAELYPDPDNLPTLTSNSIATLSGLLQELESVRANGFALEREESSYSVCCAAAPVRSPTAGVIAAISVSIPRPHWEQQDVSYWARLVRDAAERFSKQLGYTLE
jgi:IclR family KDG regulon transcriptional repressor